MNKPVRRHIFDCSFSIFLLLYHNLVQYSYLLYFYSQTWKKRRKIHIKYELVVYFQNRFVVGQRFIYKYILTWWMLRLLVSFSFLRYHYCDVVFYIICSLLCVSPSLYIFSSRFFALDMIKSLNIRFMCIWETESNKWCYIHNYEWLEASKTKSKRIFFFFLGQVSSLRICNKN